MDTAALESMEDRPMDICPDGDVVLVIGLEGARLRVNSQYLISASKIFASMFGPHWLEGQSLSKHSPTDVLLPEDNAEAMRTICCVIHHRNDMLPEDLTAKDVLQIAILVEKYDLRVALNFAIQVWLKPRSQVGMVETGRLLAAAFLLNNAEAFISHSKALVLDYGRSYMVLMKDELTSQVLPLEIGLLLEERRTILRTEVYEILLRGIKEPVCSCGWGKIRRDDLQVIERDNSPMMTIGEPISELIAEVKYGVSTKETGVEGEFCSEKNLHHESSDDHETMPEKMKELKSRAGFSIAFARSLGSSEA